MLNVTLGKLLCCFMVLGPLCCAGQSTKVEPGTALSDGSVSEAVKKTLEGKGHHLTLDDGSVRDLWLRDKVPVQAKKEVPGALYPQLAESTLIAVISFP